MCLIAWNWQPQTSTPLLLLANRDEFYARPSAPMHWWEHHEVLAGKDLQAGGTWLGLSRSGRFAALTNYRDPLLLRADAQSRGKLVSNFLQSSATVTEYLTDLREHAHQYNPFNLLLLDGTTFMGFESRGLHSFAIQTGIGAVSNAQFDTPWPKVTLLKRGLDRLGSDTDVAEEALFELLQNEEIAQDAQLPQTGIPHDRERALSAAFIRTSDYGTRCSTVVRKHASGWDIHERTFNNSGLAGEARFSC